jgi:hypothetical protein
MKWMVTSRRRQRWSDRKVHDISQHHGEERLEQVDDHPCFRHAWFRHTVLDTSLLSPVAAQNNAMS